MPFGSHNGNTKSKQDPPTTHPFNSAKSSIGKKNKKRKQKHSVTIRTTNKESMEIHWRVAFGWWGSRSFTVVGRVHIGEWQLLQIRVTMMNKQTGVGGCR